MRARRGLAGAAASWLLLALAAGPARAAGNEFARSGPYLGVAASYSTDLFENEVQDAVGLPIDIDDTWGANARLGYRALPFLAVELEYEWLDDYDVSVAGVDALSVQAQALTANLRLIAPIRRFQPYLLAGVGGVAFHAKDRLGLGLSQRQSSFAGRLGAGFELYLTRHLALDAGASVVLTTEGLESAGLPDVSPLYYVSAHGGLLVRF